MSVSFAARDATPSGRSAHWSRFVGGLAGCAARSRRTARSSWRSASSEFDPVSTEESAKRFSELAAKTETALAAARDAKDAVIGSFDVLIARTEQRTNEIMKVLTLASILLLPGALIAGVMGMNFKPSIFQHAVPFWVVNGVIVLVALATLAVARISRWI